MTTIEAEETDICAIALFEKSSCADEDGWEVTKVESNVLFR